jgi:glycosyltransferase involved in cell wall biosynthesis
MIVKNEEKYLARCLSSVNDVADEIVIVDTGSSDKTIEIAESFSAKIFHFDWVNDFSAARNFALSKCSGDWILYLDADEELNPNCIEELLKYKSHLPAGVYCSVKSLGASRSNGSVMKYPRIFANVPGIEFVGKVHEQIVDSLKQNKIPLVDSSIEIVHYGYAVDDESLKEKKERNLSLLLSNENKKNNIYDRLKLIQTLISLDKYDEAESRTNDLLKSKNICVVDISLASFYMAQIKFEKNDLKSANYFALKSYTKLNDKPDLNYLLYLINLRTNNIEEALKFILICIKSNKRLFNDKSNFESENILDQTDLYLRSINLSLQLEKKADAENIILELSRFISIEKQIEFAIVDSFFKNLLLHLTLDESGYSLFEKIIHPEHLQSVVEIVKISKDEPVVIETLKKIIQKFPDSPILYKNLAQLYINTNLEKAIELFKKSLEYDKDPAVYINLISIYISKNDYKSVTECFYLLQTNCSDKPQIKQKIDLLEEKLNPILKNHTQPQTV